MTNNNNNEENRSNLQPQKIKWLRKSWKKYWGHQSDWLEKTKGNLMIAATVIATMSYQVMVNPPGGVWQEDKTCPPSGQPDYDPYCVDRIAGTSILSYESDRYGITFTAMLASSTVSFSASMNLILLVILGLRLRNRLVMAILVLFMAVAVLGMVSSFFCAVVLVHLVDWPRFITFLSYLAFWVVIPCGIVLFKLIVGLVWIMRKTCCGRSSTQLPTLLPTTQPLQDSQV